MEEEKSIDLSKILLMDETVIDKYDICKLHDCSCNEDHTKFKIPSKYNKIQSSYSQDRIDFYLSKEHLGYSNNKKWIKDKVP